MSRLSAQMVDALRHLASGYRLQTLPNGTGTKWHAGTLRSLVKHGYIAGHPHLDRVTGRNLESWRLTDAGRAALREHDEKEAKAVTPF